MGRWRKVKQGKAQISPSTKKDGSPSKANPDERCAPVTLRLKAFLVDSFMITMPIFYVVIYLVMGSREGFRDHMGQGWLIILALHATATIAFWAFKAQTPGMKAYELFLLDPTTHERPGFVKLLLRYLMMQTAILSMFGLLIPFVLKSRAALHDLVSGTCIVWRPDA